MLSQLSTQAGSSDSAPFPDYIPYEMDEATRLRLEITDALDAQEARECLARPVNVAESSSPTTQSLHGQELVDCLTRLDQKIQSLEGLMNPLALQILAIEQKINLLIEAMAEEQDEDDEPRTYMDGTPI